MILKKHDDYDIDPDEPWRGDKLKRQQTAEYLTPIIASIDQPFVISLNAEYGMGKTDFVRRWQHDLNNRGFKTAYFNAWESDFSENALAAFMSSLKSQLIRQTKGAIQKSIKSRIGNLAKKSGGFLRHQAAPMLARAAVRKFLGEEELQALKDFELKEEDIQNLTSALAIEALAAQEAGERSMVSFRNEVEDLVVDLTKNEEEPAKRKLIIFVDELDRCRPNYALEVLESIKHLFSVPGVIFILAVDETQLRETVKTIYGSDMNGPGYFSRFFDWRLQLPVPDYYAFATYLMSLYGIEGASCFEDPAVDNDFSNPLTLVSWFAETASYFGLSPRQQIRCFTEINLVIRSAPEGQIPYCPVLGFLVVLKEIYPDECRELCLRRGNFANSREILLKALAPLPCPLLFNGPLELNLIIDDWEKGKDQLRKVEDILDGIEENFGGPMQRMQPKDRARHQNLRYVRNHLRSAVGAPEPGSLLATVYSRLERASVILQ
ncbi:MAG: P-loop NTPase fold protein [Rhodospirillales bacterium]